MSVDARTPAPTPTENQNALKSNHKFILLGIDFRYQTNINGMNEETNEGTEERTSERANEREPNQFQYLSLLSKNENGDKIEIKATQSTIKFYLTSNLALCAERKKHFSHSLCARRVCVLCVHHHFQRTQDGGRDTDRARI